VAFYGQSESALASGEETNVEFDYEKRIKELEDQVNRLSKEVRKYIHAERVMVAAGLVSEDKVKQAHEIVQNWS
jgi:hypothetical protein